MRSDILLAAKELNREIFLYKYLVGIKDDFVLIILFLVIRQIYLLAYIPIRKNIIKRNYYVMVVPIDDGTNAMVHISQVSS